MVDSHAVTEFSGVLRGIQVDLTPPAAHMLLGVPMRELEDLVVGFEDVVGRDGAGLIDRLNDTEDWELRFDLLDEFIGRRLEDARRPAPDAVWAWRRLSETEGRLPIGELAGEIGCSRRHLVSRFREHVGPAPKTAARILRFRRVLRLLDERSRSGLGEVAQDCGYYDQAHLNRDFRELAGTTPTAFAASTLSDHLGVAA
jgi:AraC-like DNA-binding protein